MQVATPNSAISSSTNSSSSNVSAAAIAAATASMGGLPGDSIVSTQIMVDHPLYPLLQIVFQKCELATCSPRDNGTEAICSSESVGDDIRNFINESTARNIPLTTGVQEIDAFMFQAIEVLRIHLLEIEKVHQLCDNFCGKYIGALKGKLPTDLVDDSSRDTASRNGNQEGGPSSNNSNSTNHQQQNNNNNNSYNPTSNSTSQNGQSNPDHHNQNNGHHHHHHHNNQNTHNNNNNHHPQDSTAAAAAAAVFGSSANGCAAAPTHDPAAAYHQSYGSFGPAGYGVHHQNPYAAHHAAYAASAAAAAAAMQPHYQVANIKHEHSKHSSNHHPHSSGSSSASSVKLEHGVSNGGQYTETNTGVTTAPDRQLHDDVRSPTGSTGSFLGDASLGSGDGTEEDDDNRGRRQQKKRGIFPKAATNIMRAWLFNHLSHPYPSEDQKKQLAEETGLTILQVNNWFINARRRIVQPMIDQTNRTSGGMMTAPAYSPDAGMGYMLGAAAAAATGADPAGQPFGSAAAAGMGGALASHAAMTSAAMGAYSAAATAQHQLSQYGRVAAAAAAQQHQHQQQHQPQHPASMLGLSTPTSGSHMMGAGHPTLPPHEYY